ncbi:MAG: diacylglycerol kinase family protein [Flavobacteriales bacterium]|nr:diacylglycerol kinase family protein [Flavobacteriales bacterium]
MFRVTTSSEFCSGLIFCNFTQQKFALKKFLLGFVYAFQGFAILVKSERNFKFHLFAFLCITIAGFYFQIEKTEWLAVLIISSVILTAEALNSAIEKLCNHVQPEIHPAIKSVKDIAAASVLISSIIAVLIACIIFLPRINKLI